MVAILLRKAPLAAAVEGLFNMQYFLGYSALIDHPPFAPSLFVEIRKRLGDDLLGEMNLRILEIAKVDEGNKGAENPRADDGGDHDSAEGCTHKGELLMDATVAPQDIAYPTDLNLLNRAREITEKIIDALHVRGDKKPRTYRKVARKAYLKVAQNRNPSKKAIRKGVGQQLRYVGRNLKHIDVLLDAIYNDGNTMTLKVLGCKIEDIQVNAYGGAIFFLSNDHCGNIVIDQSVIHNNPDGSWYPVYPA
jgi:hypothetical protein